MPDAASFESKYLAGAELFNVWNLQERILKVVLFLLSLPKDIGLPFLIITTSAELPLWEAEFLHWASSANIVVYKGNKDIRAIIRTLEFHNKQGAIMFQVLLSPYDAIVEVNFFLFSFVFLIAYNERRIIHILILKY